LLRPSGAHPRIRLNEAIVVRDRSRAAVASAGRLEQLNMSIDAIVDCPHVVRSPLLGQLDSRQPVRLDQQPTPLHLGRIVDQQRVKID
jgi:hypothetical protein